MAWMQEVAAVAEPAPTEHYELDQWLLDFANLFREVLNVEPERHLDLTQIGWERLQARLARAVSLCFHALSCHEKTLIRHGFAGDAAALPGCLVARSSTESACLSNHI